MTTDKNGEQRRGKTKYSRETTASQILHHEVKLILTKRLS